MFITFCFAFFEKIIKLYTGTKIKKIAVIIEFFGAPAADNETVAAIDHGTKGATITALFSK